MSATRLLLARHGATVFSVEDRFAGSSNVMLSEEGKNQARALGKRLAEVKISAVYSSDMQRAIDTAQFIISPRPMQPIQIPGLREVDHGHWEGVVHKEVEQKFKSEYDQWEADPYLFAPKGGETGLAVLARSLPAIREIALAHEGQNVLVVSHKATLRILLAALLGMDMRTYRNRLVQDLCCLNIVEFRGGASDARLLLFNDTTHYRNFV